MRNHKIRLLKKRPFKSLNFFWLLLLLLFSCFISSPLIGQISSEEQTTITNSLNKYLDGVGIQISELNSETTAEGRAVTGKAALFGFENLNITGYLRSNFKVKNINIAFPENASIDLAKFSKMLGQGKLTDYLPPGFPTNTGLSIKDLALSFEDNGLTLQQFDANFELGSYAIPGFNAFALDGVNLTFVIESPTKSDRKVGGSIAGSGKVGAIPVELIGALSSEPDDITFTSTMRNVNLNTVLKNFIKDADANNFLALIPSVFKSIELEELTAQIQPASSTFKGLGNSTLGDVEIQIVGGKGSKGTNVNFGIAPPATFKFSQIDAALAPMDGLDLNGTAFVMSASADEEYESTLGTLKDEKGLKVSAGFNVFSNIKFGKDLADLLKVNQLNLHGTANKTFTAVNMDAALDVDLKFSDDLKMSKVVFGTRMSTAIPLVFSISGVVEAMIAGDRLGFTASFEMSPTDQQMNGEFFMQALKKQNGAETLATKDADGKAIPPEWKEPFGIPGVGLRRVGASGGIDLKFTPLYINQLGLTGAARLGTVRDSRKHIQGDGTIVVNVTNPMKSLLSIEMKNLTILAMIEAFVEDHGIEGGLKKMLDTGLEEGKVLVVPVDGLKAFDKSYDKGVAFGAALSLAGYKGYMDFSLNDNGVSGKGSLQAINWGDGLFALTGRESDKPQMSFKLLTGTAPEIYLDGKVSLLGLSSETTVLVNNTGFEFVTTGKIFDEFEATIEAKAKSMSKDGSGFYVRAAMRNDLVEKLNKEITKEIDEATKDVKRTLENNRKNLQNAQKSLKEIDTRIAKRAAAVATRRAADLQNMRNEAARAMKEKKSVIDWHESKIRAINRDIRDLGDWPWELAEKGILYTAIGFHETSIQAEKIAYAGYNETVNGLADIGEDFPKDIELADLYTEKGLKIAAVETALLGVDIAEGVSVNTLEAAKFIVDQSLGGIFDIKSAEFEGNFGFKNEYTVKVNFNVTFAKEPHHFDALIDFKNPEKGVEKLVKDLLTGNLLKKGFKKTFATELKKAKIITSNDLETVSIGLENIKRNPKPLNTYWVTVETAPDADAGSNGSFVVDIYGSGSENYIKDLPLKKDLFSSFEPNQSVTFPLQTTQDIGNVQKINIRPVGQNRDNLKINGISVKSKANGKTVHNTCKKCNITSPKTLSFDGKNYKDYWVTISTNNTVNAGTDANVYIQLEGTKGRTKQIEVSEMYDGNAFERGELMEFPLSFEDVGTLKNVIIKGGSAIDNWIYGGITITDEKAKALINYCNCPMDGDARKMPLRNINYYKDYRITLQTKSGNVFDDYGTDSDVYFTLIGNKGRTNKVQGESFLRAEGSLIGENLYANGTSNFGDLTDNDVGNLQKIKVHNIGDDEWTFTKIELQKGRQIYESIGEEFVVEDGEIEVPLRLVKTEKPNSNFTTTTTISTTNTQIKPNKNYVLELKHSKKVLGVSNGQAKRGHQIVQYMNNQKQTQQFQFIQEGAYYKIKPKTGQHLFFDVEGGSKKGGAKIVLWSGTKNDNQLFKLTPVGNGYFSISPKSNPQMALDVPASSQNNNTGIIQWSYTGKDNQLFKLIEVK